MFKSNAVTKNIIIAALAAVLATGCTPKNSEIEPTLTSESVPDTAGLPTDGASGPHPQANSAAELEELKAQAIANGRPAAAWDIDCVAWVVPETQNSEQQWADRLGQEFLASRAASCPDAIIFPYYFIESFAAGEPGELLVKIEPELNRIMALKVDDSLDAHNLANGILATLMGTNPDLRTVTVEGLRGGQSISSDRLTVQQHHDAGDDYYNVGGY